MRPKTQTLFVLAFVLPALAPRPALADADALRQCRAMADATARLACYDAIALPAPPPAAAPAPAAEGAGAAPPAPALREARFGLPEERRPAGEADRLDSRIDGRFEGWAPRGRIRLANGQVWQVTDDSRGAYWLDSPKVSVRRGALGSYFMEIEGVRARVRVVRLE